MMSSYTPDSTAELQTTASDMNRGSLLKIMMQNFVFCTLVAVLLWQFVPSVGQYGFFNCFVHAQAIGNTIALMAIGLTRWGISAGIGDNLAKVLGILVSTVLGTLIGLWLAGTVLGLRTGPLDFFYDADEYIVTAITAVLASLAFNWHLNRREKLTRLELRATRQQHRADRAHHAMLRAQLDPHMFFNTLANLRALINTDTEQAIAMLDRLDGFMRQSLKASRSTHHTLQEETAVLDDYLSLLQIRLQDRLQYKIDIPATCRNVQIPTLLLQPLVENAVRHGIEPNVEGGLVSISAQLTQNALNLVVEDTGVGMDTSVIARINNTTVNTSFNKNRASKPNTADQAQYPPQHSPQRLPQRGDSGFGLENLRERLHLAYGTDAQLHITPSTMNNTGTRVEITIPVKPPA
jgi:sensor histidine kinase YesM